MLNYRYTIFMDKQKCYFDYHNTAGYLSDRIRQDKMNAMINLGLTALLF